MLYSRPRFQKPAIGLLLSLALLCGNSANGSDSPHKVSPRKLSRILQTASPEVHYGTLSVAAGDTVEHSVAVVEGQLELAAGSLIRGEIWVINGDLILVGDARIEGTVNLVNGSLFQSRAAQVTGRIQKYRCLCELNADVFEEQGKVEFISVPDPEELQLKLKARSGPFNRVDYSSVVVGVQRGNPDNPRPHWRANADLILPLRNNTRGYLGFDLDILIPVHGKTTDLRIRGFKKTVTNDAWQLSTGENSAALLISHSDFLNYYERSGGSLGAVWHPGDSWTLEGDAYLDHSQSLITRSVTSLANNGRALRNNPPVDRGEILGTTVGITFDTRNVPGYPASAWFAHAVIEKGWDTGPGDFSFTTLMVDIRRYNRLWRAINLDFRGRLFTAFDDLPRQRWQTLNGYGALRGLHDLPFSDTRGDRLAVFSTELRIPMPDVPLLRILYSRWQLLLFGDIGILRLDGGSTGAWDFLDAGNDAWGKSIGFGISGESFLPYLGLYVAQDLDRRNKRPRFIIRATRNL